MKDFHLSENSRCGFVCLIGAPNAGKSTFLNSVLGTKIAIVSQKVQTTRVRMLGIKNHQESQIVFVDTPGVFKAKKRLEKSMVSAAWQGAGDADLVLHIVDATKSINNDETQAIIEQLKESKTKAVLILNKVDLLERSKLLKIVDRFSKAYDYEQFFLISAENNDGVSDVVDYLAKTMPKGIWHYQDDQLSDMPMRSLAAEITREKIFHKLHDELPYDIYVETEKWDEQKNGSVKISQIIYVKRDSQKSIVLGHKGQQIKEIGALAREEIGELIGATVHLYLYVKVRENWESDRDFYRQWGLDYHA